MTTDEESNTINRAVLVVRAKQPFLDWLRRLHQPADLPLELINRDNTAYLVPDYGPDAEREAILAGCFSLIFEGQLAEW